MAVVLYDPNQAAATGASSSGGTGATVASSGSKTGDSAELERVAKRIEALSQNARTAPYIGL